MGGAGTACLLQLLQRNSLWFDETAFDTQLGSEHNAWELSASLEGSKKCHLSIKRKRESSIPRGSRQRALTKLSVWSQYSLDEPGFSKTASEPPLSPTSVFSLFAQLPSPTGALPLTFQTSHTIRGYRGNLFSWELRLKCDTGTLPLNGSSLYILPPCTTLVHEWISTVFPGEHSVWRPLICR